MSNPYQDLQNEALDSAKKTSLTERLTTVRNNVCEHQLRTVTSHLDKERTHSLRNLHMDTSNLRYQVKVMDINKRKNDLAMQKRIRPRKDFSYDSRQIDNSSKRLGMSSEGSFYLEKKLKFPLRGTIVKDHDQKPIIKRARQTLVDYSKRKREEKSQDRVQTARTYDRATTAQTMSTTVEILSPEPPPENPKKTFQRGGSKSAPPPKISFNEIPRPSSHLSVIDEVDAKLPKLPNTRQGARSNKSHVKFDTKASKSITPTAVPLHRSNTYYSGMTRTSRSYSDWDSDSDDDYMFCEKVDLRALFFGDKSQNGDAKSTASGNITPRSVNTRLSADSSALRRCSTAQPKVTEEMLIKEQKDIKNKIDHFLGIMKKEDSKPKPKVEEKTAEQIAEEKKSKDIMSKAALLLSVFSKPIDHSKMWGFVPKKQSQDVKVEVKVESKDDKKKESEDPDEENKTKNLWELIRTEVKNGGISSNKRKYTANDLLLQQLTGILVHADSKTQIPLHAASRALRHTPTFKMQRVVEELMRARTRYEQQEVERLQAAEGAGGHGGSGDPEDKIGAMVTEESGVHKLVVTPRTQVVNTPRGAWGAPTTPTPQAVSPKPKDLEQVMFNI